MMQKLAIVGLGFSCLLLADDDRQRVEVAKTEHIDFQPGGVLRLKNSVGELTVEGWDGPGVELTTVRSTKADYSPRERENAAKELDRVHVSAQHDGNELTITTEHPGGRGLACFFGGTSHFNLEYRIKVPANTRLIADHGVGEVHVDGLTSDIQVKVCQGEITLHLPEDGQYTTDAKSKAGSVFSEFARGEAPVLAHRPPDRECGFAGGTQTEPKGRLRGHYHSEDTGA